MQSNDALGMLLFFSIFEVLGGGAVGIALRGILQRDFSGMFFLIWGSGFGGIPLVIAAAMFLSAHQANYFFATLFVFFAPLLLVLLIPHDFLSSTNPTLTAESGAAIVGAVITVIGGAVVLLTWRNGIGFPLLIGAVVALVGIVILLRTAIQVIHTT